MPGRREEDLRCWVGWQRPSRWCPIASEARRNRENIEFGDRSLAQFQEPSFWLLLEYSSCEVLARDRVLNYAKLTTVSGGTASGSGFCRFPVLDSAKAERRQAESRFRSPGCHQPQPMCSWFTLFTASFV